jgi:hypothetical protein
VKVEPVSNEPLKGNNLIEVMAAVFRQRLTQAPARLELLERDNPVLKVVVLE